MARRRRARRRHIEVGSILGQIAGAIIGGGAGQVVSLGTQFGLGTAFLKSRPRIRAPGRYSRGADHGARRIRPARHGQHVPDDSGESGNGGPEWMSSHPNPSNRYQAINQEASQLAHVESDPQTPGVHQVKSRLQRMAPAPTTEQVARRAIAGPTGGQRRLPCGQVERRRAASRRLTAAISFALRSVKLARDPGTTLSRSLPKAAMATITDRASSRTACRLVSREATRTTFGPRPVN